jgi:hypothetical protein
MVAADAVGAGGHAPLQPLRPGDGRVAGLQMFKQSRNLNILDGRLHHPRVQPGHVDQAVQQRLQHIQPLFQMPEGIAALLVRDMAVQRAREHEQRLNRLAQVMAGGGKEAGFRGRHMLGGLFRGLHGVAGFDHVGNIR